MDKEDIAALAQLLIAMREALEKLEKAKEREDMEDLTSAKRAIIEFQEKIDELV